MMVFAAQPEMEEVRLVSSQQLLQHHHCLTLLSIHSSPAHSSPDQPRPDVAAVQLICKEVQLEQQKQQQQQQQQ